jgi:hypothetical protein
MSIVVEETRLKEAVQVMDTLVARTAANDDHVSAAAAQQAVQAGVTGGWNAYDVWRRLIKDARDRRERRGHATTR